MNDPIEFAHDYMTPTGDPGNGNPLFGYFDVSDDFNGYDRPFQTSDFGYASSPFARGLGVNHVSINHARHYGKRYIYELTACGGIEHALGKWNNRFHRSLLQNVSDIALHDMRNGSALLCLNIAFEGDPLLSIRMFDLLHEELSLYGICPTNVLVVTSNLSAKSLYTEWFPGNPHSDQPINIVELNLFEYIVDESVFRNPENFVTEEQAREAKRTHAYLCFNRRPHAHRQVLVSQLSKRNLLSRGLVSMDKLSENKWSRKLDAGKWDRVYPNILDDLDTLSEKLPLHVDCDEFVTNHAFTNVVEPYLETLFSVITETIYLGTVHPNEQMFFSEKIFKPMVNYQPFIMVGRPHSLARLREFGYQTFDKWIDESYDGIEDDQDRMAAVLDLITELPTTEDAIQEMYLDMFPTLVHNRENFKARQSHIFTPVREGMVEFITNGKYL